MNIFKKIYQLYYKPKIFFPKKTYSMFGEDLIISKYFNNKKKGLYLDVGCYHPLEGSNTYLLYKKGWQGINLDANELSIELFNVARKKDQNFNIAISNKAKKVKIYFRKKINMLNTIDKKTAKINFRKGYQSKYVQTDSLNSVLNKSKFKNKKIDFLNLDIEGNELEALKSFNFKKYRPKSICVEIHNRKKTQNNKYYLKDPVYKLLINKRYKFFWNSEFSFIFLDRLQTKG